MKFALSLALLVAPTLAFMPRHHAKANNRPATWELHELILGEEEGSVPFDAGSGGVRLAEESAIKIFGDVKHKPGTATAEPKNLLRYYKLTSIDDAKVQEGLKKNGSKVICTGQGVELYKDPGSTLEKYVRLGPQEAIKEAFASAAPAIECDKLVFNFLGGEDAMLAEVVDATNELVVMLDINTKAKISFNSVSHSEIPEGTSAVTVVAVGEGDDEEEEGSDVEKAIAAGEIYARDGKWFTVQESDINPAIA